MDDLYCERLKRLREEKGFTQYQITEVLGLSEFYCSRIENNHKNPSLSLHAEICKILDVPSDYFFYENKKRMFLNEAQVKYLSLLSRDKLESILDVLQILYERRR